MTAHDQKLDGTIEALWIRHLKRKRHIANILIFIKRLASQAVGKWEKG